MISCSRRFCKITISNSQTELETTSARRTTVDIYADILEVVKRHGGKGRITRLSYGCGMPVDRLKKFLEKLERYGLVRGNDIETDEGVPARAFILTPRGQEFLDTYWKMKAFLDVFGES